MITLVGAGAESAEPKGRHGAKAIASVVTASLRGRFGPKSDVSQPRRDPVDIHGGNGPSLSVMVRCTLKPDARRSP